MRDSTVLLKYVRRGIHYRHISAHRQTRTKRITTRHIDVIERITNIQTHRQTARLDTLLLDTQT